MKKIYLSALALAVGLFAMAQGPLTTSFEDYNLGTVNEQNGWMLMAQSQSALVDLTPGIANLASISDAAASDGSKSLLLAKDDGSLASEGAVAYIGLKMFTIPATGTHSISFDVKLENDGNGSGQLQVTFEHVDMVTQAQTPQGGFMFAGNDATSAFAGPMEPGVNDVSGVGVPWETWINYEIEFNLDDNKATFYIGGQEIAEFAITKVPNVLALVNFGATNSTYIDNFVVTESGSSVSIDEFSKNVKVYPNPASNYVNFDVDGLENGNISITSLTGQEVINTSINSSTTVDVANLKAGVYIYTIRDSNNELVKTNKLVIK